MIATALDRNISNILASTGIASRRWTASSPFPSLRSNAAERLEQLRFLENGIPIHVAETRFDTIGVDTEEDLRRVEEILGSRR